MLNFQETVFQLMNKVSALLVKSDISLIVQLDNVMLIQLTHANNINIMIVKENPLRNIQEDAKKYVSAVLKDFI